MGRIDGRLALISGGASGLGLASAQRLAAEGATVIIGDINQELGEAASSGIDNIHFEYLDVRQEENWESLIDKLVSIYGKLDILLNNAGIVELASIEQTDEALWRKINAVSTDGTFFGCKHAVRVMKETGCGSIINMCSSASIVGGPNIFAYAASKSAIRGMTKSVACLSAQNGYGFRCNSIHPGRMKTPMLDGILNVVRAADLEMAAQMEDTWIGKPQDVANMVLFLASDESVSVNGSEMVVDNTTTITEGVVPQF